MQRQSGFLITIVPSSVDMSCAAIKDYFDNRQVGLESFPRAELSMFPLHDNLLILLV
jgi:hypothetical protein